MAEVATVARPYARAAFGYAQSANALGRWTDVLGIASTAVSDERVRLLLGNPAVSAEQLADLLVGLAGDRADEQSSNFIRLLAQNHRLGLLPEIASQYEQMRADVENTADVNITSAVELTEAQVAVFKAALEKRLKRSVRLHLAIDRDLVGGAIVQSGDFVIDGSLKGKVERLGQAMTN